MRKKPMIPNSASGPLHPDEPPHNELWEELIILCHKLIDRLSEEGFVVLAILAFKGCMQWLGTDQVMTECLAFMALGGYLTLRLLNILAKRN